MNNNCIFIDPRTDKRWDAFIESHPHGSVYHHSLWMEVLERSYGYRPVYVALEDSQGALVGGIPLCIVKSFITGTRLVSVPFADWSDFLVNGSEDESTLLKGVFECSRKFNTPHIEIRTKQSSLFLNSSPYSKKLSFKNHCLVLDTEHQITRSKFDSHTRRNIEKAGRHGFHIHTATEEKDMEMFYYIYVHSRKIHGLIPQPYEFFKNIWNIFFPRKMASLLFAFDKSVPVSGILLLKFKDTMYYLYGGTIHDYFPKSPSYLLLWNGIKLAMNQGFGFFDFGKTHPDNEGLMAFKRRWGTIERDICMFSYGTNDGNNLLVNRTKSISPIFLTPCKVLPEFIVKFIGTVIYRHLG